MKKNWNDSDDLAMMFESGFSKEYYRQLHRYVHSIYRKKKGYNNLKKIIENPLGLNYKDLRSGLSTFYDIPATFSKHLRLKKLETS